MLHKIIYPAQCASSNDGCGEHLKYARMAELVAPIFRDISKSILEETSRSRWEETDRQAIERGEDDGMIIRQAANMSKIGGISANVIC